MHISRFSTQNKFYVNMIQTTKTKWKNKWKERKRLKGTWINSCFLQVTLWGVDTRVVSVNYALWSHFWSERILFVLQKRGLSVVCSAQLFFPSGVIQPVPGLLINMQKGYHKNPRLNTESNLSIIVFEEKCQYYNTM